MIEQEVQRPITLLLRQLINLLGKPLIYKDPLPTSNRVRANDRMAGGQILTNIQGRSSVLSELDVPVFDEIDEALTGVGGGEAFEELLVGGREAVVGFVGGCPEGVT